LILNILIGLPRSIVLVIKLTSFINLTNRYHQTEQYLVIKMGKIYVEDRLYIKGIIGHL
jgi:hypothetical protein